MAKATFNCSFCAANDKDVQVLIAGPNVYICNECVLTCVNVLLDKDLYKFKKKAKRKTNKNGIK